MNDDPLAEFVDEIEEEAKEAREEIKVIIEYFAPVFMLQLMAKRTPEEWQRMARMAPRELAALLGRNGD